MANKPTVLVLAGGEGKRFNPLATDKTLFPFLGKPLIEHTIDAFVEAGFEEFVVVSNVNNLEYLQQKYQDQVKLQVVLQQHPLGMADAVLSVADFIQDKSVLIINAVDVIDPQFVPNLFNATQSVEALVVGKKVTQHTPAGYLEVEGDRVISVIEKPELGQEPSDLINLVFHYYRNSARFLELIRSIETQTDDVYEQALAKLMREIKVSYLPYSGPWAKLKYPHFVLDVMDTLLNLNNQNYIAQNAKVADTAIIQGNVYIDEGVTIYEHAVIKGPTYIGKNTKVGDHSLVLNSMIENECVVGAHSEVTRSYLGPKTYLHHNFVGDSVLEGDINPSYGTCFTNLRLDKQPVQIKIEDSSIDTGREKLGSIVAQGMFSGVNCSFMPGTVVATNVKVHPGKVVKGYIPADSVVT